MSIQFGDKELAKWQELESRPLEIGDSVSIENVDNPMADISKEYNRIRSNEVGSCGRIVAINKDRYKVFIPGNPDIEMTFAKSEIEYNGSTFLEALGLAPRMNT